MATQYWIGDFFIDLSRNQITYNDESKILAPKALAVLTCLAENQGNVVSQDELLAMVWQNSVVSPNTLQRSIAQIRKAMGDDGKGQNYIKTHAKQGYSLECEVRWHDNDEVISQKLASPSSNQADIATLASHGDANSETNRAIQSTMGDTHQAEPLNIKITLVAMLFGVILLAVISYQFFTPDQTPRLYFGELRALTATDNKETAGIYSPDGQYIVFHRYSEEFCVNNIWAKNIKTQQEYQLTKNLDLYGSHSFSQDGKQLAFIQSADCSKPITQKKCYKLLSLDFSQALKSPQSPREMMECKNSEIRTPKWLSNNNIALMQKTASRWKLINYSISENQSQVIYEVNDGNIIYYDYSMTQGLFAITSIHHDGHYYIEMLNTDGQLVSSHRIQKPSEISKFRYIFPRFSPLEKQLIFSTGRQLFTLSYDGQVANVSVPLDVPVGTPVFHPDGNRALLIKGYYDSDIVAVPMSEEAPVNSENGIVIERSTMAEDNGISQPDGELLAYKSDRSGEEQVWITNGKESWQLSQFPMDTYIFGMDWAADGKSLLVNANDELTEVTLDASHTAFSLEHPVENLFQWNSNNNTALALISVNGGIKLAELNLTRSEARIINDNPVYWASKSEDGQLIYLDQMERFWRSGAVEDQLIDALDGYGSDKQRFLIKEHVIYGVNDELQLWSYALNDDTFKVIRQLPNNLDYITDVNQEQLLMTVRVASKKEVAELVLSD